MTTTDKGNTNSGPRTVTAPRRGPAHSATDTADLSEIFARQRAAFDRNRSPSLHERRANLLKL